MSIHTNAALQDAMLKLIRSTYRREGIIVYKRASYPSNMEVWPPEGLLSAHLKITSSSQIRGQ